ncbi:DExH-box ATP-dependent RNA helicase DExH5, mitochondrial-like [Helianthus annuus]|uniref:DExH-box ATP-dependent RNA helicase DExH5, mitochondrial-like n=1 Tax=Helianthus annuus TaxID=4232 RepID=UPI000B8F199D|nr:DExH-box ATP-dependent RNA helicase DExH5, mitochondrial-like [Helianthus annuus]
MWLLWQRSGMKKGEFEGHLKDVTEKLIFGLFVMNRRGRAGRVQPGECYHLYPRCVYNAFAEYQLPEILRTPLQSLCLQIKSLKLGSISEFLSKALQSPKLLAVQNAIEYLKVSGALDESENLTVLGMQIFLCFVLNMNAACILDGHLRMMGAYLEFFMDPGLAKMYQSLRRELDKLIQCKLTNPRMDIHTHHELLSAIRLLLPEDKCNGKFVFDRQVLYKDSKPYIASVPAPAPPASRLESGPGGDNPKGQLQTLLMRAGCPAPTYRTTQLSDNQFRSICEFNGMQIMGHPCHNKKQAEKDAAAEALERLTGGNNISILAGDFLLFRAGCTLIATATINDLLA